MNKWIKMVKGSSLLNSIWLMPVHTQFLWNTENLHFPARLLNEIAEKHLFRVIVTAKRSTNRIFHVSCPPNWLLLSSYAPFFLIFSLTTSFRQSVFYRSSKYHMCVCVCVWMQPCTLYSVQYSIPYLYESKRWANFQNTERDPNLVGWWIACAKHSTTLR